MQTKITLELDTMAADTLANMLVDLWAATSHDEFSDEPIDSQIQTTRENFNTIKAYLKKNHPDIDVGGLLDVTI